MGPYRPRGVYNTKVIRPLILSARRPRLRRGLLQQRRIVPGCLKTPSALEGGRVVPSMVFPSHRYRGTTLPVIRWRLAISSLSTVFPTCGYRVGDATKLVSTSSILSPSTVLPTCGYRGGDTADTWVGDARNVSCWRRPLRLSWRRLGHLMLASPWALSLPWH